MEEEWELVDISGSFHAWAMAEEHNSLVYSVGSHIIVWNLDSDTKSHLRCHEFNITSIKFHPSQEYFITIEASKDPFISVWDWENLQQVCVKFLPPKIRKQSLQCLDSCVYENFLYILEVEKEGGYRMTRWEWQGSTLEFLDSFALESKEKAFKIRPMTGTHIFVAEKTFVKIWEVGDRVFLSKRLYFKSEILDVEYCDELCAFAILLGSYNFIVVNSLGVILTTFSQNYYSFFIFSEYLFLGGTSLQVFSLKNYSLISEMLENSLKIVRIVVNGGNLACIKFENSTVQVVDLEHGSVVRVTAFHSTKVVGLSWSLNGNFVSHGDENCVYRWEKQEIGWGLEAFELGQEAVTAVDLCGELMALGFSNGNTSIYDENMEIVACHRASNSKVTDVKFSPSGVLVCAFSNGFVAILDSTYTRTEAILQEDYHNNNQKTKVSLCELLDNSDSLVMVCSIKDSHTLSVHRVSKKSYCKAIGFTNIIIESEFSDFKIHVSGKYVVVALNIDYICLYEVITNRLVGVIETTGVLSMDTSGLYLSCLQGEENCKVQVYEIGTGELVTEMSRIANGYSLQWSYDGKLLAITGNDGKIEVWKIPEVVRFNIEKMLSRGEEDIWDKFPIVYENKTIRKKPPIFKIPNDTHLTNSTFADTIVSLIPKQKLIQKPPAFEVPNFRAPEVHVTKFSEIEPRMTYPKINKLYIPTRSNDTIYNENPIGKVSFVHKPQNVKSILNVMDSPVSLTGKSRTKKVVDTPVVLARTAKNKDEPISFTKTTVKRNSFVSDRRNRINGPFTIDIERNLA